ncbi:MAG: leucine-rich repeat protein [Candidatus Cloacimonetes bacterium]|nr:leucine-rich repeat protein [Candidatus Cloacimonadota bacterium]
MKKTIYFLFILIPLFCMSCKNEVTKPDSEIAVTAIVLSYSSLDMEIGSQLHLTATVIPNDATNQSFEWFFSDPNIVTMDLNGLVTALNFGKTIISVKTEDGGFTSECEIYVANNIADFTYLIHEETNTVEITGYLGSSNSLFIPRIIEDKPVNILGVNSFHNMSLTNVYIPEGISLIEEGAFSSNLFTILILPNSIRRIEASAFSNNMLTELSFGEGVIFIGRYSFEWNQLSCVVFPNSVTSIGTYAFSNNLLTEVEFGNGLARILWGSFMNNNISSVDLPHSLVSILSSVFAGNPMTRISIGDGVEMRNPIVTGNFNEIYGGVGGIFTRSSPENEEWERQ